jgi:hypothetical protein
MNSEEYRRKISLLVLLFFVSLMFIGLQTQPANALVPVVESVTPWTSGTLTILNITITHVGSPPIGPSHYISSVEVDVNGTLNTLPQSIPQSTTTFLVQYDMGVISGTLSVQARAFCIVHGYSSWSNTVIVPEFSFFPLVMFFAFATLLVMFLKFVRFRRNKRW